jgi:hypothetical protein
MNEITIREELLSRLADIQTSIEHTTSISGIVELDQTANGRLTRMDAMQQAAMESARRTRLENESRKYLAALARLDCGDYGRRSRGHGLARLDGTRPRATVADKVMESGKMVEQATATSYGAARRQAPARRPEAGKPGRRRQGCARLAKASPVRDERGANLEQRGLR